MRRSIPSIVLQAALGSLLVAAPFALLLGADTNDVWVWIAVVTAAIALAPVAVALLTGSVHAALGPRSRAHHAGMVRGYLLGLVGGAILHAGLLVLYLLVGLAPRPAVGLLALLAVLDVLLFHLGYRIGVSRGPSGRDARAPTPQGG